MSDKDLPRVDGWEPLPPLAEFAAHISDLKVRRGRLVATTRDGLSHIVPLPKDDDEAGPAPL